MPGTLHTDLGHIKCEIACDEAPKTTTEFESFCDIDLNTLVPPGTKCGRFDNGLNYLVKRLTDSPGFAYITVAVKAGSVMEEDHEQGIAHLVVCEESNMLQPLYAVLQEFVRISALGFTSGEIDEAQSAKLRIKDNPETSCSVTGDFLQLFFYKTPLVSKDFKSRFRKIICTGAIAEEVNEAAKYIFTSCSCAIMAIGPDSLISVTDFDNVRMAIESERAEGNIKQLEFVEEDDNGEEKVIDIVAISPEKGTPVECHSRSFTKVDEILLSNGMRIFYKCMDLKDDPAMIHGIARGGVSQLSESQYSSGRLADKVAPLLGLFGYDPGYFEKVLNQMNLHLGISVLPYKRTFYGSCDASQLEELLKLVYQLFITTIKDDKEACELARLQLKEQLPYGDKSSPELSNLRDGTDYFKKITAEGIDEMDIDFACSFFNNCFCDPAAFQVTIVSNQQLDEALPWILTYLGGVPIIKDHVMKFELAEIKDLPVTYPSVVAVASHPYVYLSIPLTLGIHDKRHEAWMAGFVTTLLESRMVKYLRFDKAESYNVQTSNTFEAQNPFTDSDWHGYLNISFSCSLGKGDELVKIAFDEICRLQEVGPTDDEVRRIRESASVRIAKPMDAEEWILNFVDLYSSSSEAIVDIDSVHQEEEAARKRAIQSLSVDGMRDALRRILPYPCK